MQSVQGTCLAWNYTVMYSAWNYNIISIPRGTKATIIIKILLSLDTAVFLSMGEGRVHAMISEITLCRYIHLDFLPESMTVC